VEIALASVAQIRGGYQNGEFSCEVLDVKRLIPLAVLIIVTGSMAAGEIKIENPKHLDVPEQKARVLLKLACQAVVNELHLSGRSNADFDLRLVIGGADEGYVIDQASGMPTIYLRQWDETKFTTAALKLAVQKSIDRAHEERMIPDVLRRSDQIAPISVNRLQNAGVSSTAPMSREDLGCLNEIVDASKPSVRCGPLAPIQRR
jgi:hypothetical protein